MGSVRTLAGRGSLFLDFRYEGRRRREYTALPDTPQNRKRLEKLLTKLEAEIAAGTFDYAKTFPSSSAARAPSPPQIAAALASADRTDNIETTGKTAPSTPATPVLRVYSEQWMRDHEIEWRRSHIKVLRSTIDKHLLPPLGDRPVGSIGKPDILSLRAKLASLPGRSGRGLSNKRINGILAPLRQMLNEAADQYGFASPVTTLKPLKVRKTDVDPSLMATQTPPPMATSNSPTLTALR